MPCARTSLGLVPGRDKERGDRLRDLRERRSWSQEDVARSLVPPVTAKTVYNWEGGATPRPEHLRALAALYERPVEELQGKAEVPEPFKLAEYINESLEEFREWCSLIKEQMDKQDAERGRIARRIESIENALGRIELMLAIPADERAKQLAEALEDRPTAPERPAHGRATPGPKHRASA